MFVHNMRQFIASGIDPSLRLGSQTQSELGQLVRCHPVRSCTAEYPAVPRRLGSQTPSVSSLSPPIGRWRARVRCGPVCACVEVRAHVSCALTQVGSLHVMEMFGVATLQLDAPSPSWATVVADTQVSSPVPRRGAFVRCIALRTAPCTLSAACGTAAQVEVYVISRQELNLFQAETLNRICDSYEALLRRSGKTTCSTQRTKMQPHMRHCRTEWACQPLRSKPRSQ